MIDKRTVFEIHRLKNAGMSNRVIAGELQLNRETVSRYLKDPNPLPMQRKEKPSKLDPYRDLAGQIIEEHPAVKAPVVLQALKAKGFDGEITIVRKLLRKLRGRSCRREAFIRVESEPGRQMQIDWGHFQSLRYGELSRKLYVLAVIESHSRNLYVFFSHSQKQEYLHLGLLAAFRYFGGCPQELVVDNMLTAVTERVGTIIRFNEAFLDFLRPFKITPRACNVRAPHEKGKVENAIKYIRQNFWPLRSFGDIDDVQRQMHEWLDGVANCRVHETTGEKPAKRLRQEALQSLPEHLPEARETSTSLVHKDFGIRFDGNVYTVPPWTIGKKLPVKADLQTVSVYYRDKCVAAHSRIWARKQRQELTEHREQVRKMRKKLYQEMTPTMIHQPVKLKQQALNRIRLECPSLKDYDAIALQRRKK